MIIRFVIIRSKSSRLFSNSSSSSMSTFTTASASSRANTNLEVVGAIVAGIRRRVRVVYVFASAVNAAGFLLLLLGEQVLFLLEHLMLLLFGVFARQDVVEPEQLALGEHKVEQFTNSASGQHLFVFLLSLKLFKKWQISKYCLFFLFLK